MKDACQLRSKLQSLVTPDTITNIREKWLASMGMIDPYLVVAKRIDSPSFYVIHRTNGHAVFVTSGLWDPTAADTASVTTTPPTSNVETLPDIELLVEARESELGSDLSNCWLFQCLLEIACTAKRNYNKVRRLLKERQYATVEVFCLACA